MQIGIIGNCQYNALIDLYGDVIWLCWPRFDSSFVFGHLLDRQKGGRFQISPPNHSGEGVPPGRQAYIENTNVLRTVFETDRGSFELIDFAPRFYQYNRYFKPTTLVRIVRPISGEPLVQVRCRPTWNYGSETLQPTFGSNHIRFSGADQQLRLTTNASLNLVYEGRPFIADRDLYFVMTYGQPLETNLSSTSEEFLDQTIWYWQKWVKHCFLPRDYQKEVIRSALVLKLHQFEDTGAIIAATTTSIPEAEGTERNWDYRYCWLRDALFSLIALQRLTHFEEMEGFVKYLRNIVATLPNDDNSRLQPVFGISGEHQLTERTLSHLEGYQGHKPVRIGNQAYEHIQHDVYGEMILAVSQLFLDNRFVDMHQNRPHALLTTLIKRIRNFCHQPDAGLWEYRGISQVHTFSLLMHWAGSAMAEEIAKLCGYREILEISRELRQRTAEVIFRSCWSDSKRAFTQSPDGEQMDASLLMLINLGFLKPDDPRAASHLDAVVQHLAAHNGFIHRYKHPDDFGETNNTFTICSFWLAEAYARIGRISQAKELFEKLLFCANHLGLYSEDIDPATGALWGNFPQTYSHVGLINAAFSLARENTGPAYLSPAD